MFGKYCNDLFVNNCFIITLSFAGGYTTAVLDVGPNHKFDFISIENDVPFSLAFKKE